ncbi:unnamed protein product [Zymoseptoria tritici ST99CH_1E4]|uniref:Small ribosomal subunit protein mS41 n=1 Tax=Zymoseptoria tritici ST99CH_1E4 TaxID=1276532 RepID=A0A2H1GNV1_ZYMTR|nr:unnamed protein product [Zymoseptoria tritici ST99CH_1E4]
MASKCPISFLSFSTVLRAPKPTTTRIQCRHLHRLNAPAPKIPSPTPFVPDAATFLTLIGRNMSTHAAKIPSWDALFTLSSLQLREAGIEPPRARKYLLWWRERFRNGITGIGGDLKFVEDGMAELRIVEVKDDARRDAGDATVTGGEGMRKVVVNTPPTILGQEGKVGVMARLAPPPVMDAAKVVPVKGVRIVEATKIGGTGVEPVKRHQGVARLRVQDGLWEQRRGHKVDGGERRKAEVRAKRRAAERKAR